MKIKNPNFFGRWEFFLLDHKGEELRIPAKNNAPNLPSLVDSIIEQIKQFDGVTNGEYSHLLREQATNQKLTFRDYIRMLAEHQICLRDPNPSRLCYDNGFGDQVHRFFSSLDNMVSKSKISLIREAATIFTKVTTKLATGTAQSKFSSCQKCGGTKTLSPTANNLGRAGLLNRYSQKSA